MNLVVLHYLQNDRIKPSYHLGEGDKILMTAKIYRSDEGRRPNGKSTKDRDYGLYFVNVVMNKLPMWEYTYKGFHPSPGGFFKMDFEKHLKHDQRVVAGVIENRMIYDTVREKNVKDMVVLYGRE